MLRVTDQVSAEHVAPSLQFAEMVGLISFGDCVVHVVSLLEASAQPMRNVTVVLAANAPPLSIVHVMEGEEIVNVQVLVPSSL